MNRVSKQTAAFVVGATLWILLPLLVAGAAFRNDANQSFASAAPVWVTATQNTDPVTNDVQVALIWGPPNNLVAPAWNGIVQAVQVHAGDTVTDADAITVIDGITRLAANTPRPFYRALTSGDTGNDVTMLNSWLAANGYEHATGRTYTTATSNGVNALARKINASTTKGFDPTWLIYLPSPKIALTTVTITPATPAPSAGTPIATASPSLVNAILLNPGTISTDTTTPGGTPVPATFTAADKVTATPDQTLTVNGQEVPLAENRDSVVETARPTLGASVQPGTPAINATLDSPAPSAVVVPSNTVFTDANGTLCAVTDENNPHGVKVVIAGNRGNDTMISDGITAGTRVQVAPPASERSCP